VSSTSTNITVRFGLRLKTLRKKRGWTQVEMAERLGIDRSYISDMERGKKNVLGFLRSEDLFVVPDEMFW
jgi:transcriptional regulator with XRE-family HTH domain